MNQVSIITQIVKDIVIIFATIIGVIHGWKALKQWRLEMRGRNQYDVAKRIALKAIELAESLHSVRFSWEWDKKHEELYKEKLQYKEPENYREKEYLRFQTKVNIAHEYWVELQQLRYLAEVVQIEIEESLIKDFFEIRGELAASTVSVYENPSGLMKQDNDKLDERWRVVHGCREDGFGKRIEVAKENVLEAVKEYLE